MPVKDRIKEIREVRAGELLVNPANFRGHPETQRSSVEGLLAEVGNVDVLKVYETEQGLMLLDGHLRRDLLGDEVVKVAVLDLDEEEARKVLLTFDRVTTLAELDPDSLGKLMESVAVEDAHVQDMIRDWREEIPMLREGVEVLDPQGEWKGMPEFSHDDLSGAYRIVMHFKNFEDVKRFGALIDQPITENTQALWYPPDERATLTDKFYGDPEQGPQPTVDEPPEPDAVAEPEEAAP